MMVDTMKNILLIEDNPDDVELTLHAFRRNNILNPISIFRDGHEALDYLSRTGKYTDSQHPDPALILLDLKLPKVDGIEILRTIKGSETLKTIPVVILTSSKEEKDVVESYNLSANSYIRKPVDFDEFVDTIRHLGYYWLLLNEPSK